MKIIVCSSMSFAAEYSKIEKQLKPMGHTVFVPIWTDEFLKWERDNNWWSKELLESETKEQLDYFKIMEDGDCLLVTNYKKNWISWYIWWWVFMEMSVGFYLRKPIFLLNQLPNEKQLRYVQEISIMQPIVLDWNLKLLNIRD